MEKKVIKPVNKTTKPMEMKRKYTDEEIMEIARKEYGNRKPSKTWIEAMRLVGTGRINDMRAVLK